MGQSTVVSCENTSHTDRESDSVFWCDNNVWYTCREAVKFFQEHGDGALYHAEDNVRNVFKTQNVDVETGTMFGAQNNALTTSEAMVSDFLSEVLYENPESRDASVTVFDELMSLPPHTAYHIVSTSSLYPVEVFDAALGEHQSLTNQIQWMKKGLNGYKRCVSVVPDSLEHGTTTTDPTMKSEWDTCVEKTFKRTTISREVLNLAVFYALSVPPSHRSLVMDNVDYIMDRFVTYCHSLDGDVLERVKESAYWITPDITVVPEDYDEPSIFSPVAMAVVCATAGDDISLWCDMVLTMLGCDVISLHGADTMMFIVDHHDVVCDFPLSWVETMGRSYCQ